MVLLISCFYYFPDSRPVHPTPIAPLCSDLQRSRGGAFPPSACLTPFLSPLSTTAERFSCRRELSSSSTHKNKPNGLFQPVTLNNLLVFRKRINRFVFFLLFFFFLNKSTSAPMAFLCRLFSKSKRGRKTGPCYTRVGYICSFPAATLVCLGACDSFRDPDVTLAMIRLAVRAEAAPSTRLGNSQS